MQEYFHPQPSTSPLFHRRQRSNTAPSTLSPLTVVSSSLTNWNGEAVAAMNGGEPLPTFSFTPDTSSALTPTTASMAPPMQPFACPDPFAPDGARAALMSTMEMDLERTPRRADFPLGIQEQFIHYPGAQMAPMAGTYPASAQGEATSNLAMSSYDLEAYMAGLNALSIAPAPYDMSPFQNVDFDDFLYMDQD